MTHWATDESKCKNSWTKSNCIHLRSYKSKMEPVYNNSIPEIADNTKQWKNGKALNIQWFHEKWFYYFIWSLIFSLDISYNDTVWEINTFKSISECLVYHCLRVNHWLKKYWIFSDFCFRLFSKQKPSSCLKQWSLYTILELLNNADLVDKVTNDWQRLFWAWKFIKLMDNCRSKVK